MSYFPLAGGRADARVRRPRKRSGLAGALLLAVTLSGLGGCADPQQRDYNAALQLLAGNRLAAAVERLNALARNGFAPAQFRLGVLYLHGTGVPQQPRQAAYWFDRAAQQGDVGGRYSMARLYISGVGVDRNLKLAAGFLEPLAEQNYAPAQFELGLLYDVGIDGERDLEQAERWIRRAAENDHPKAIQAMIQAYKRGLLGLPKDPALAEYWQQRARPKYF